MACPLVIMMGESIGGEQCSNLAHLPFSKKSGGEKGRVCGYAVCAQYSTPLAPVLFPTCNSTGSGHCFHRRNSSHLHARWRRVRLEGWWWWRWCGRKKGGKCPRRRMDHHYSLTGKITSPGTGTGPICMMDQQRKRQSSATE